MRTLESIQEEIKNLDGTVDLLEMTKATNTSKEVKHLPEILEDEEQIKYLTSGFMSGTTWLIVCTQKRIILLDYGMFFGVKQSEMALDKINSVSYKIGLFFGSIEIWHGGAKMIIENCPKPTVKHFVDAVNLAIKELKNTETSEAKASNQDDTIAKLEKLAALKEKGILTEEEFAQQKAKILAE
ncbi:PH domain-containing protein [bacterium]|nr:PH domain-containing protein [bacterium]